MPGNVVGMPRTTPTAHRRRLPTIVVGLVGLVASLAACSKPVPSNTELVDALQRTGMSATESRCVSDAILDTLSKDQVAAIVDRGASGAPVDAVGKTGGPLAKVRAALTACQDAAGGTTTTITVPEEQTTTSSVITDQIDPATTTTTAVATTTGG
ncbi:hypothetical protein BH10ACT1_BH10ACT1_25110 [soil metagenome]